MPVTDVRGKNGELEGGKGFEKPPPGTPETDPNAHHIEPQWEDFINEGPVGVKGKIDNFENGKSSVKKSASAPEPKAAVPKADVKGEGSELGRQD